MTLRSIIQLRPTGRFAACAILGSLPCVFAPSSMTALTWGVGWNVFLVLLAVVDAVCLLRDLQLRVGRRFDDRVQARQVLRIEYSFFSARNVSIDFVDELPSTFEIVRPLPSARWALVGGREVHQSALVKPLSRGHAHFGNSNVMVQSNLGLLSRRLCFRAEGPQTIRVLPRLRGLDASYLDPKLMLAQMGLRPKPKRGDGTEFHRIREAQAGDSLNRVDWRATARAGKNMVRDYRPEQCDDIILCLDCGRLMGSLHGDDLTKLDHAIESALRFALLALSAGDRVGLLSFAEQPGPWTKPTRGRKHLSELMMATYDLSCSSGDSDYANVMLQIAKRQTKRALIVFFTDFFDVDASAAMLESLTILKRRHRVLFLGITDPVIRDAVNQVVDKDEDVLRSLAALHLDLARSRLIDEVSKLGIEALDVAPDKLTNASLNAYLQIRARGIS